MTERKSARRESPRFGSSEVPLYYQLGTILREQILSGAYAIGDQLPTEAELVADYGVSRITVRQALKTLEDEDLVRREAGRGTFVTGRPLGDTLQMEDTLDDLMSMGLATSVELLDLRPVAVTPQDAETFRLGPVGPATDTERPSGATDTERPSGAMDTERPSGTPGGREATRSVMQCARLRRHHETPYGYIVNRVPIAIAERFEDEDWGSGSIMQVMEQRLGLRLRVADQTIRATLADAPLARLLETRIGAPLLSVDRVVRTDDGHAVARVHTYYRSDVYSLNVHLTRDGDAR